MVQKQNTGVKEMTFFRLDLKMVFFKPIEHQFSLVQHYFNAWGKKYKYHLGKATRCQTVGPLDIVPLDDKS